MVQSFEFAKLDRIDTMLRGVKCSHDCLQKQIATKRLEIEASLIACAEKSDAALVIALNARDNMRTEEEARMQLMRDDRGEKEERIRASRETRARMNAQLTVVREAELAARNNLRNRVERDSSKAVNDDKRSAKKQISIEHARDHEHAKKQRENERVAELQMRMQVVAIGAAIQNGE